MFHVYVVIIRSYKYKTYHSREVELLELLLLNADGLEVVPKLGVSLQILLTCPFCPGNNLKIETTIYVWTILKFSPSQNVRILFFHCTFIECNLKESSVKQRNLSLGLERKHLGKKWPQSNGGGGVSHMNSCLEAFMKILLQCKIS